MYSRIHQCIEDSINDSKTPKIWFADELIQKYTTDVNNHYIIYVLQKYLGINLRFYPRLITNP